MTSRRSEGQRPKDKGASSEGQRPKDTGASLEGQRPKDTGRRILVLGPLSLVLLVAAGIGYYLWSAHGAGPPPPPVPAALTDPAIRKVIEAKRQAVLGA